MTLIIVKDFVGGDWAIDFYLKLGYITAFQPHAKLRVK